MISDTLSDAASEIRDYQRRFPGACAPYRAEIRRVLAAIDALRIKLDTPPAPDWHNDFEGRVEYAAHVIAAGNRATRKFDSCFEHYDGSLVAAALFRRARKLPAGKLARNIGRYLNPGKYAPDDGSDLAARASEMRKRALEATR